jgi:hypothetical protein
VEKLMGNPKTRIMYIECKDGALNGQARIGRVTFSKSGRSVEYGGQRFLKAKGYKWNHFEEETGARYWISGPHKDGKDRLYANSSQPVTVDEDVRLEYWCEIRGIPQAHNRKTAN